MPRHLAVILLALLVAGPGGAAEPVRLANHPALSPDGKTLAFDHLGDIWTVPTAGGVARPLTQNAGRDTQPKFSPDGREIAFVSDRDGSPQVYVVPAGGGVPRQVTFHTAGYALHEWAPDGKSLLVSSQRDHGWGRRQADRFFRVDVRDRRAEELLFDDYGGNGTLSPDGKKLLFTREGPEWWRKGYTGAMASQIWLYDLDKKTFTSVLREDIDHRWPLWKPDGKGLYLCTNTPNGFVLQELSLDALQAAQGEGEARPPAARDVARFADDSIVFPCISRDGSTLVFRHLANFYRLHPGSKPEKIEIVRADDRADERLARRTLDRATAVAFTGDGLEIAFLSGGDLWVMDTELREPKAVTSTAEEERTPLFAPDGQSILFVADRDGRTDLWRATRADTGKPWWLNNDFKLVRVTDDGEPKSNLRFSPDGAKLAYVRGRGDLWVADADGKNAKQVIESWNAPDYDWSPDGRWLVYANYDNDFNRDVWILPLDGSRPAFNLSRHPYNEDSPVWSPDGRLIAFVGARETKDATDVHYVYLRAEDDEKDSRDRTLEKALEKIQKARASKNEPAGKDDPKPPMPPKKGPPEVVIDFEGIHDRIHRVRVANSSERNLLWSPDSKRLAFTASIDGQSGLYSIELPDKLRPTLLSSQSGSQARWLKNNQIVWLAGGLPASISGSGGPAAPSPSPAASPTGRPSRFGGGAASAAPGSYRFTAYQEIDLARRNQAAFDMCWRVMRDQWYDEKLGNRDWNAVRAKLRPLAETADAETLTAVVQLMLGELNGSHLGFSAGRRFPTAPGTPSEPEGASEWRPVTPHLGVRFDDTYQGDGLKVRDVLPEGPAAQKRSALHSGEIVVAIDGTALKAGRDPTELLNGPLSRDVVLRVKGNDGKEREVTLRPISFATARGLVYKKWLQDNRTAVDRLSKGTLGYLHIRAMDMLSFHEFQEALYDAGAGKSGLVIDVRENGGGSTTDHLLTALTQPRHAITVPRGGGTGYPQDRTVYATWNKPIVVLCNQNSFSNAEIFSHAIKSLKRGQLVGVPTAGAVISTGATSIMDVGTLRLPFRGWYVAGDGQDMELHGAVPHHVVWPAPGEMPAGKDAQLERAVAVLLADVQEWQKRPQPRLQKATER